MVTLEVETLPTVARITVRNGDVAFVQDINHDTLDDAGIAGLVRLIAAMLEAVQSVAE
jgi:hypothetical protein